MPPPPPEPGRPAAELDLDKSEVLLTAAAVPGLKAVIASDNRLPPPPWAETTSALAEPAPENAAASDSTEARIRNRCVIHAPTPASGGYTRDHGSRAATVHPAPIQHQATAGLTQRCRCRARTAHQATSAPHGAPALRPYKRGSPVRTRVAPTKFPQLEHGFGASQAVDEDLRIRFVAAVIAAITVIASSQPKT